jgi:hypothetical protein
VNWAQLAWLMFVEKDLIAVEARYFSLLQNAHPALEPTQPRIQLEGMAVSSRGLSDRSVKLTIDLFLVPTLRKSLAVCLVAVVSWSPHCFVTCNMTGGGRECC